jgi:hypothetical protein
VVQPFIAGRVITSVSFWGVPALVTTGYFLVLRRDLGMDGSTPNATIGAGFPRTHVLLKQLLSVLTMQNGAQVAAEVTKKGNRERG